MTCDSKIKKLVRVYNAYGLLKKIVVGNARIKYQLYIFFCPLSMFHLLGEFKTFVTNRIEEIRYVVHRILSSGGIYRQM
jgi:hypothetical protein